MLSKLPRWIWAGTWVLAFVAGMVNVIGLLGFERRALTHLTGTTSLLATAIASLDLKQTLHLAAMIGSFVAGTVISGMLVQDSSLKLGRRYGVALLLESLLLCAAIPFLRKHHATGDYFAACAIGLQNAIVSTYSGSVVRTAHLTGMFTDLGIFLGHFLKGIPVDLLRLRLCLNIISAFLSGGIAAAACFPYLAYDTLAIPALITLGLAWAYHRYRLQHG